jgi:hypothetical protein
MGDVVELRPSIQPMAPSAIDNVRRLEEYSLANCEQVPIEIDHHIHGGMYIRTAHMPAEVLLTGALIKVPTFVIVRGHASIYVGEDAPLVVSGYTVLAAAAGRKQAFFSHEPVSITMVFPTNAKTVEEAEEEMTDEAHMLTSRRNT